MLVLTILPPLQEYMIYGKTRTFKLLAQDFSICEIEKQCISELCVHYKLVCNSPKHARIQHITFMYLAYTELNNDQSVPFALFLTGLQGTQNYFLSLRNHFTFLPHQFFVVLCFLLFLESKIKYFLKVKLVIS